MSKTNQNPAVAPAVTKTVAFKFVPQSKADIEKSILSIIKRSASVDRDIQLTALQCLNHVELHGDVTLFNRLYLGLSKGMKRNALAQWAIAFGKLEINTGEDKATMPLSFCKGKKTQLQEASETLWSSFKTEKELDEIIDVAKVLDAMLKRMTKEGVKVSDPELVKRIVAVVHPEQA